MYKKSLITIGEVVDSQAGYKHGNWAYLPHSCQEWVIGGRGEVEQMIEDLREILKKL